MFGFFYINTQSLHEWGWASKCRISLECVL